MPLLVWSLLTEVIKYKGTILLHIIYALDCNLAKEVWEQGCSDHDQAIDRNDGNHACAVGVTDAQTD